MSIDILHLKTAKPAFNNLVEIEVLAPSDFLAFFNKFAIETDFLLINNDNGREFFMLPYKNFVFKTETKGYKTIAEMELGVEKGCANALDYYHQEAIERGFENDQQYFEARELGFVDSMETIQSKYQYYIFHDSQIREYLDVSSEGNFYRSILKAGFRNFNDFDDALNLGFKDSASFYSAVDSGFKSAHDFEEAIRLGFANEREYHESKKYGYASKMEVEFVKWRSEHGIPGNKLDEDFLYYIVKFEMNDMSSVSGDELYQQYKNKLVKVFGVKFSSEYHRLSHSTGLGSDKDRDKNRRLYKRSIRYKEDMIFVLTEKLNISDIAEYNAATDTFLFKR